MMQQYEKRSAFAPAAFGVRQLIVLVLSALLLAVPGSLLATETALAAKDAQTGTYVFDERGLFTSEQFNSLEAKGAELASKYNMGVYFLTTSTMNGMSDPSSRERTDFATNYYKQHNLGLNPKDQSYGDGIMFVIAADSRDYVTIAYGQGSYSFSDKGIASMEDAVLDNIRDHADDWYGAATTYYDEIGSQLAYYAQNGKAKVPMSLFDWLIRIFIVLGIPLIVTFFIISAWRSEMLTAKEQSEAGNYLDRDSVQVTRATDKFIRTSIVATPKPKNEDSGGGGWGGGGGGGFSSSGGGKF